MAGGRRLEGLGNGVAALAGGRRGSSTAGAPLVGSRQKGSRCSGGQRRVAAARSLEWTPEGGGSRGSGTASLHSRDAGAAGCGEHAPPSPVRRRPRSPAVSTRHRHLSSPPRESPNRIGLLSYKKEGSSAVSSIRLCAWTSTSFKSRTTWTRKKHYVAFEFVGGRIAEFAEGRRTSGMPFNIANGGYSRGM